MSLTVAEQAWSSIFRMSLCVLPSAPKKTTLTGVHPHPAIYVMMRIMGELGWRILCEDESMEIEIVEERSQEIMISELQKAPECLCILGPLLARRERVVMNSRGGDRDAAEFFKRHILTLKETGINVHQTDDDRVVILTLPK